MSNNPAEDDRLQSARHHLECAIALLDALHLHQAAANADLALSQIGARQPQIAIHPDWPSLQ